ncbi:hypothetical protein DWU98_19280 [Dyella monticola]|uniref:GH18 domain-containing protein n=1 Tax=Dyella monticola TaxID=1927958 RepID=A0A370WSK7_9GAMM|nr:hypothetical protein [Dyella monticola]RDS79148.1 hypothetical protein DWU98_19280 [Dyella monticola]
MPWIKTANAAQYEGADWSNFVKTVHNCTPAQAQLIAFQDPSISYFFYCREYMILTNGRSFNPGDAVFFNSTRAPWYGSAPQCDAYKRQCVAVAYASPGGVKAAADLTYNGAPALDAILFPANLNMKSTGLPSGTSWVDPNGAGPTMLRANSDVMQALTGDDIAYAHAKGIAVLVTGLNNHDAAGWSEFPATAAGQADAQQFAGQCQYTLSTYQVDGIDIDDEYSAGTPVEGSLAMVGHYVRQSIGTASFSKALFEDVSYFQPSYGGTNLGQDLTWGWTMSYWEGPQDQLPPYQGLMPNNHLLCGFNAGSGFYNPTASDLQWMAQQGYAGVMVYNIDATDAQTLLATLLSDWPTG